VARAKKALEATADEIRQNGNVEVTTVAADVATEAGRQATLAACHDPDILVNNAGGPPAGDFRKFSHDDWIRALEANMLTPNELFKAAVDGMIERRDGRIINMTSAAVKVPISILGLSNGARAGLAGFIAGLSRQTPPHNVTINDILPGAFATDTMKSRMAAMAKQSDKTVDEIARQRLISIPAGRFGDPFGFGQLCACICSAQASFIAGQNRLIDVGACPGTL